MKNGIKLIFFAVAFFAVKTSTAQVNIGAQTATKVVTQAVLPTVQTATTQKVIRQATANIASHVANQTQASVRAVQNQAANISGQVSNTTQSAVQAGQSQPTVVGVTATSTNALNVTSNKNHLKGSSSSSTKAKANTGNLSAAASLNSNGRANLSKRGVSLAGSSTAHGKTVIGESSNKIKATSHGTFSATAHKTAAAKASIRAKRAKAAAFTAKTVNKTKRGIHRTRVNSSGSARISGSGSLSASSKKAGIATKNSSFVSANVKAGKRHTGLSTSSSSAASLSASKK